MLEIVQKLLIIKPTSGKIRKKLKLIAWVYGELYIFYSKQAFDIQKF